MWLRAPVQFRRHSPSFIHRSNFGCRTLTYQDDLPHFQLGGFAQNMTAIRDGYFDALTLHNSFEHFMGNADSEFMREVDRVLS